VVGELTEDAAPALLGAGELDEAAVRSRVDQLFVPILEAGAESRTLTPEEETFVEKFPAFVERLDGVIEQHTANGIETVMAALDGAGVTLPPPAAAVPDEERRRHIWVQYASGTGWIDLDPSMPAAEPGDVFAADPTPLDALPPN